MLRNEEVEHQSNRRAFPKDMRQPMRYDVGVLVRHLAAALLLASMVSCSFDESEPVADEVCALTARFEGRTYTLRGEFKPPLQPGSSIGEAVVPTCDGRDGFTIDVLAIDGIDTSIAFVALRYPSGVFVSGDVQVMPPALERLRRGTR